MPYMGAKFGSATITSWPRPSRHRATHSLSVEASSTMRARGRSPSTAAKRAAPSGSGAQSTRPGRPGCRSDFPSCAHRCQYGPWLAPFSLRLLAGDLSVGQSMPPRRVGGQPLHPIYALIALRRRPSYAVSMKMPSATCHGPGVQSLFITPHGDSLCNGLTLKSAELANQPGRHSRVEAPRGRLAAHERICRDHAALAHDRAEQQDRAEADPRAFLHADRRGLAREDAKQPFRAVAVLMRDEGRAAGNHAVAADPDLIGQVEVDAIADVAVVADVQMREGAG